MSGPERMSGCLLRLSMEKDGFHHSTTHLLALLQIPSNAFLTLLLFFPFFFFLPSSERARPTSPILGDVQSLPKLLLVL